VTHDTEELPDRDPCPDLPELTPAERAAMNALPGDFAARVCRGERPLDDPAVRERVRAAAEAAEADLEIVCAACLARPPAPRDTLCVECRAFGPLRLPPVPAALPGQGPQAHSLRPVPPTHGELTLSLQAARDALSAEMDRSNALAREVARLREGCRKILARALRELTCPPGQEDARLALRTILDEAAALAEG
jgi:hypothetical protein